MERVWTDGRKCFERWHLVDHYLLLSEMRPVILSRYMPSMLLQNLGWGLRSNLLCHHKVLSKRSLGPGIRSGSLLTSFEFPRPGIVFNLLFPINVSASLIWGVGQLRHKEVRLVDPLALALKARFLLLRSEEVFSALDANIITRQRGSYRSPGTLEVREIDESFLEEDGPLHANELQEKCLQ